MSYENGVNGEYGTEANLEGEGVMPGRCSTGEQGGPGRYPATAISKRRITWSKDINRVVIECYIKSKPDEKQGYRKRMHQAWKDKGMFEVTEQRLADQVRQILKKGWFTDIEIEEMKRKIIEESGEALEVDCGLNEIQDENTFTHQDPYVENEAHHVPHEPSETNLDSVFSMEELEIVTRIRSIMNSKERVRIPNLRKVNKKLLNLQLEKVDTILGKIHTTNITSTNDLIYAGAVVVTERLGVKLNQKYDGKEPMWKRRLDGQIKQLRKDLAMVELLLEGKNIKKKCKEELQQKYWLHKKGNRRVAEEIRQRIKAKASKVKRYQSRVKQFHQNRLFQTDQKRFYEELEGEERVDIKPDGDEARQFWSDIWGKSKEHNSNAEWLKKLKAEVGTEKQQQVSISASKVKRILGKMPNWKAPGPDLVQGFWLKNFTSVHSRLVVQLDDCIKNGNVPSWMTKGRTVLIIKDKNKGSIASNFRPITCLPMVWKLLTGVLAEEIYGHLDKQHAFVEEQKGCRKGARGTHDLLFIDKMVLKEARNRKKNLSMAWVDYKKAYDMVPHSWILECLNLFGIADNVKQLIQTTMKSWRTELSACGELLGEVKINRGIFQGDTLSPLLFVISLIPMTLVLRDINIGYYLYGGQKINQLLFMDDLKLFAKDENGLDSLVQTVRVFSEDIGMQFGIEKCAVLTLKRGKKVFSEGIKLPDETVIKSLVEGDGYKYLGVLEDDQIMSCKMKEILRKEYGRRVRKIMQSKLSGGNSIKAVNSWAVSLLRYSAPFVNWTRLELQEMDRKTRKIMNMNRALAPRDSVARLYLPRKEGGRGLIAVEDCVDIAVLGLEKYIQTNEEPLISAARVSAEIESVKSYKQRKKEERYAEWKTKALHGQYINDIEEISSKESWTWLVKGQLKKETEGLIMAAQTQSLRTNVIKAKIDKSQDNAKCRLCKSKEETVNHIVSGCQNLAQKEYKRRHDTVAKALHWDILRQKGFPHEPQWYKHDPEAVVENDKFKILWDFTIQTDHIITARRPDIVVIDKQRKKCQIVDIAIPVDGRIDKKEEEKIEKYQELAREIKKLWNLKVKVIPIVVGALGSVTERLTEYLSEMGVTTRVELIQKSALLGSARILRKVLEV